MEKIPAPIISTPLLKEKNINTNFFEIESDKKNKIEIKIS